MFLTKMPLNPQRRSTRELVSSPQRLHAAVLAGFLPGTASQERVLWRLDTDGRHELNLYVVSPSRPSFDALVEQAGWSASPVWRTADYAPFLTRLAQGQRWVFRLTANPVRSVRPPDASIGGRQRGRRVALVTVEDQTEWLLSRSSGLGFLVPSGGSGQPNLSLSSRSRNRFQRRSDGDSRTVTLETVRFDGVLEVTDADVLRQTLVRGVGSGKGYGCGLMTLASLQ